MPTKKKVAKHSTATKKSSSNKKTVKKSVVKKTISKKKKTVAKSKRKTTKKTMAIAASVDTLKTPFVPPMKLMPQDSNCFKTVSCSSCRHLPVSANAVVGVLSILALALSIAVITLLIINESQDYQIRAFNTGNVSLEGVARL